jgi:hypothetical protein
MDSTNLTTTLEHLDILSFSVLLHDYPKLLLVKDNTCYEVYGINRMGARVWFRTITKDIYGQLIAL